MEHIMTAIHLFSDDQTGRWIGPTLFQPERNQGVSYCGQIFGLDYQAHRITDDIEQATCRRCLYSHGRRVLGLSTGVLPARKARLALATHPPPRDFAQHEPEFDEEQLDFINASINRLGNGPPMSDQDLIAFRALARILNLDFQP
jgi:hypothetical protein